MFLCLEKWVCHPICTLPKAKPIRISIDAKPALASNAATTKGENIRTKKMRTVTAIAPPMLYGLLFLSIFEPQGQDTIRMYTAATIEHARAQPTAYGHMHEEEIRSYLFCKISDMLWKRGECLINLYTEQRPPSKRQDAHQDYNSEACAFSKSARSFTFLRPITTSLRRISASFSPVFSTNLLTFSSVCLSSRVDQVFLLKPRHHTTISRY